MNRQGQKHTIAFSGIDAQLPDYAAKDGTLDICINAINEDGTLRPIISGTPLGILIPHGAKVYHHLGQNLIIVTHEKAYWVASTLEQQGGQGETGTTEENTLLTFNDDTQFVDIATTAKFLLISTTSGTHHFLWREDHYETLGTEIPNIDIRFALDTKLVHKQYEHLLSKATSSSGLAQGDAQFEVMATRNNPDTSVAYRADFDFSNVTLVPGVQYMISISVPLIQRFNRPILYGKVNGEGEYVAFKSDFPDASQGGSGSGRYTFTVDRTYTNVFARCTTSSVYGMSSIRNGGGEMSIYRNVATTDLSGEIFIEHTKENYDKLFAIVNQFRQEEANNKNKFLHPFFVRYAVRMFDGTIAHISNPCLMVPNFGNVPMIFFSSTMEELGTFHPYASAEIATLTASISHGEINPMWEQLIQQVEIYATPPIYPYNQGEEFQSSKIMFKQHTVNNPASCTHDVFSDSRQVELNGDGEQTYHKRHQLMHRIAREIYGNEMEGKFTIVTPSPKDEESILKDISTASDFRLIATIPFTNDKLNEYADGYKEIPLKEYATTDIHTCPALNESELAAAMPFGGRLFEYNGRVHSWAAKTKLPTPCSAVEMAGLVYEYRGHGLYSDYSSAPIMISVEVETDDGLKTVVRKYTDEELYCLREPSWLFYPHAGAKSITMELKGFPSGKERRTYPLTPHDTLNGAYYCALPTPLGVIDLVETEEIDEFSNITGRQNQCTVDKPHTIFVSETNNPFSFRNAATVTISGNTIHHISTITQPISEGQFGQFPLYAFTDNGVWSLDTNNIGTYGAKHPITRDIILTGTTPLQTDNSVIFATTRGIMEIAGRSVNCISEPLKQLMQSYIVGGLTNFDVLQNQAAFEQGYSNFGAFIQNANMLFDYKHQRVILYNAAHPQQYVYSLKTRLWAQAEMGIKGNTNIYPECIAVSQSNELVNLSKEADADTSVLLLTRPITFGSHLVLKALHEIKLITNAPMATIALWGSHDLKQWEPIDATVDTAMRLIFSDTYNAFRIGVVARLTPIDSIAGLNLTFKPDNLLAR